MKYIRGIFFSRSQQVPVHFYCKVEAELSYASIISVLHGSMDEEPPISSVFPQSFLFSNFLPTVSSFHNVFSSTCWYYLVLGHALKLNSNNILTALVLSSILTWPHLCTVALETLWTILCSNLFSKNLISDSIWTACFSKMLVTTYWTSWKS